MPLRLNSLGRLSSDTPRMSTRMMPQLNRARNTGRCCRFRARSCGLASACRSRSAATASIAFMRSRTERSTSSASRDTTENCWADRVSSMSWRRKWLMKKVAIHNVDTTASSTPTVMRVRSERQESAVENPEDMSC